MKKLWLTLPILLLVCAPAFAQDGGDIRAVDIDTQTPEGKLVSQAGMAESTDEKIELLEQFVQNYNDHELIDYVRLQLLNFHLEKQNFDKAVEYGEAVVKVAPQDLEIRHNLTKAYEGAQKWEPLLPHLLETKPLAEKEAATPKPEDADEQEEAIWKGQVEYAQGIIDYVEYSLYTSAYKQTDPATKIRYLEALLEHYPDGKYSKQGLDQLVLAGRQSGDTEKMIEAMKTAVEIDDTNEEYLYTLAEASLGQQNTVEAKQYGERLLELIQNKPKPENMTEEDWAARKELFTGYGHLVLGKAAVVEAGENNKEKFREARTHLLEAVDPIKAQGGPNYQALAYFLGICYIKLDVGGDNVDQSLMWMDAAASIDGPLKAQAQQVLNSIRAAIRK